jgi:hypothetical protein
MFAFVNVGQFWRAFQLICEISNRVRVDDLDVLMPYLLRDAPGVWTRRRTATQTVLHHRVDGFP